MSLTDWSLLPFLVYMVIGLCFAARGVEIKQMDWSKVREDISAVDQTVRFIVKYIRKKQAGPPVEEEAFITGKAECRILSFWFSRFPVANRVGRLFSYLSASGDPCNNKPIGKEPLRTCAERIALRLGYTPELAKLKTGHWTRANSLTLAAEQGEDAAALQRLGGHASIKVMNGYIGRTEVAKCHQAAVLSVDSPLRPPASKKSRHSPGSFFDDGPGKGGGGSHTHTHSSTYNGSSVIFQNCDFSTSHGVLSGFFGQFEATKKAVQTEEEVQDV